MTNVIIVVIDNYDEYLKIYNDIINSYIDENELIIMHNVLNKEKIKTLTYKCIIIDSSYSIDLIRKSLKSAKTLYIDYEENKQKNIIISLCYNEIKILPFVINYWKLISNKAIIYDNGSNDGTIEYLTNHHSDFVEIRTFRYKENKINEEELRNFKTNCWKEFKDKYEWVIVCDIDEVLYHHNIGKFLHYINTNEIALVKPIGYQLISTEFPEWQNELLLHNYVKYGVKDKKFDKILMFNTSRIKEINYDYGCHLCYPEIIDGYAYMFNDIKLFHCKWLTLEYVIEKYRSSASRLSQFNIENKFGTEYLKDIESLKREYSNLIDNSEFISDWYDIDNFKLVDSSKLDNIAKVNPNNSKLSIVIPIYQECKEYEYENLYALFSLISDKYDIIFLCPNNLKMSSYFQFLKTINVKFSVKFVRLDDEWFDSLETYNQLCLNWKFYDIFSNYEYMLIYQLDSILHYDNLEYFMSLEYDFIGAPHNAPYKICGNGGFSLRKIKSMINILKNTDIDYTIYEDIFINSKIINKTPLNICRMFAVSWPKIDEYSKYISMPMGEHYFINNN